MKKLFFTVFVVLFFSVLFIAETAITTIAKLVGYVPRVVGSRVKTA